MALASDGRYNNKRNPQFDAYTGLRPFRTVAEPSAFGTLNNLRSFRWLKCLGMSLYLSIEVESNS